MVQKLEEAILPNPHFRNITPFGRNNPVVFSSSFFALTKKSKLEQPKTNQNTH
jgi:hypothetical protein